jgi:hypothetical protein
MPVPQMIETPAMRRSAMLAKLLEEQRQPVEIKGGYGELAARLLGQGITQFSANRAEKAARTEREQRFETQASGINEVLAGLLQRSGRGEAPATEAPAPMPTPALMPTPTTVPMPSAPVSTGPVAPVGEVMGSNLPNVGQPIPVANVPPATPVAPAEAMPQPTLENALLSGPLPTQPGPVAPAPQMAAPVAPQPAPNALGITPGEQARIGRIVELARTSRDPALLAYAQSELDAIDQRMNAAPEYTSVMVNNVPFLQDQFGNMREAFPNGLPESVMTRDEFSPEGTRRGTYGQRDRYGRLTILSEPPQFFQEGESGGYEPIRGGKEDITSPGRSFEQLSQVRQEIRPILDQATQLNRNINAVRTGVRQNNGPGDIAMVNGLQKLIDEGVVKGEDVDLQLQAQGVSGGIAGLSAFLTSSGRFDARIRAQISAAAEDLYSNMNNVYAQRALGYAPLVERTFGAGAFDDVLPPSTREAFGWSAPVPTGGRDRRSQSRPGRPPASAPNNDPLRLR